MKPMPGLSHLALPAALLAGAVLIGLAVWAYEPPPPKDVTPVPAGPMPAAEATPPASPLEADDSPPAYLGAAACTKCHIRQHQSWCRTRMASSFDALKPCDLGTYDGKHLAEKRREAGLDPEGDYRTNPQCLKCHTTGYGRPGGYPEVVTPENRETAERLQGVQCEACHGPGSRYVPFFQELMSARGEYRRSEVMALGLILPEREVCLGCHNSESPFVPEEPFDFVAMKEKGTHEHTRVRRRIEEDEGGEDGE